MDFERGCDLYDAGRLDEAEMAFRRAADRGHPEARFNLANSLRDLGRPLEAIDAYKLAIGLGQVDGWLNLGIVLEDLGDLVGAQRAYEGGVAASAFATWAASCSRPG